MERIALAERPNWKETAEEAGFMFHTMYGEPYWDESSAYAFTLDQIESDIEDPSTELHEMCLQAAEKICGSQEIMERLAIPEGSRDFVANSLRQGDPELYGRFDLIYDGQGPAKMIEYNADTPTSLFEAASFQWQWLEDQIASGVLPQGSDQFNSIHEALAARFAEMFSKGENVHFSAHGDAETNLEDYSTTECLAWAANEAGLIPHYTRLEDIGLDKDGQFADGEDRIIKSLFKLYPWEDMLRDDFARNLAGANCQFIEPAWKAVVSNKGMLPVLWDMFEGHPNLLPCFFQDDITSNAPIVQRSADALARGHVTKPIFSREGASVTISENGLVTEAAEDRSYDDNTMIVQGYHPMPVMDGFRPIIGAWIVGKTCVGLGVREDQSRITQDLSRFKPHFIRA
jgi:glutathionylspermidine synthase